MTALPIIETQAGDVSAFIPTNVISITDGQIFLDVNMFNSGVRPAINTGLSVSRVGGAAQTKIIKKLAGGLRIAAAQFRELEAFSQFASDLDEATRKQLERGQRIYEMLKQPQYHPLSVAEIAYSWFLVDKGFLDDVAVDKVMDFANAFLGWLNDQHKADIDAINATPVLDDATSAKMKATIAEFKKTQSY